MWSVRKRPEPPHRRGADGRARPGRPAGAATLRAGRSSRAGFTLIEVLVAVTVAIILGGALVRFFGDVRARSTRSEDTLAAWTVARAILEQTTAKPGLTATTAVGAAGRYGWRLEITPIGEITPPARDPAVEGGSTEENRQGGLFSAATAVTWTAFRVRVVVEGPRGGAARLETVQVAGGGAPASGPEGE